MHFLIFPFFSHIWYFPSFLALLFLFPRFPPISIFSRLYRRLLKGNKELTSIGIFAGIGHTEKPSALMADLEILVFEFLPVDTSASRSVVIREISPLDHEVGDQTVESGILIGERRVWAQAQRKEVVAGFGNEGVEKFKFHAHYFLWNN